MYIRSAFCEDKTEIWFHSALCGEEKSGYNVCAGDTIEKNGDMSSM